MVYITCPGCRTRFSRKGWQLHLTQTSNTACRTIHDRHHAYVPGLRKNQDDIEDSETHRDLGTSDVSDGEDSVEFRSGSCSEETRASGLDSDYSGDDSEQDLFDDHSGVHGSGPAPDDEDNDGVAIDDECGRLLTHAERQHLEESIWVKPLISEYPDRNAGQVYTSDSYSGYKDYEDQLDSQADTSNCYAPFTSKVDWEFARWAKLRGPGSTSASELMAIDGVCPTRFLPLIWF